MSNRRHFIKATIVAAALASMGMSAHAADTIKVGILHSLSGTMAISETVLKDTVLMAIDDINKKGGVLGKQLEPVVVDPASNWPLFAEKTKQLLGQDKVSVIFGCWTSVSRKSVLIGMGSGGAVTRVLAARYGSRWTYAGNGVAPGQLPVARLVGEFLFRRIRSDSAVYGVLGRPVSRSLSPAMHNAGFAALGLNAAYVPIETRDLEDLRAFAAEIGLRGLSVTIPFKQDVMPLLDEIAPAAEAAGAVNTIAIRDGRWIGSNTDADGFLEPLRARGLDLRALRVVILGAGGAARGVGLALAREGAHVAISARRVDAAGRVARDIGAQTTTWPPPARWWDVLVNATPVGSRAIPGTPFDGPFDGRLVYDLVYEPDPTELMQRAAQAGVEAIGGLAMLVAQAERQFEIWTSRRPPAGLFAEAAVSAQRARQAADQNGIERATPRERTGERGSGAGAPRD